MPELLPRDLVDSGNNFNLPENDAIFTAPGCLMPFRAFEKINVEDFAYTIDYYLKLQNKSTVYLVDYPETFEPRFNNFVHVVASKLYGEYKMPFHNVRYINGAWPVPENIEFYKKHCRENDWLEIPITLTNYFEFSMKEHLRYNPINLNDIDKVQKSKIFLSMNGGARWHRAYLMTYLFRNKLLDKSHFSMHTNFEGIYYIWRHLHEKSPWFKDFRRLLDYWLEKSPPLPMILSLKPNDFAGQHIITKEDIKYFSDSYFSVIGETSFFKQDFLTEAEFGYNMSMSQAHLDSTFLTEKTFRAIACRHPFIIMSRPHTLRNLRRMGYKTFSPIIDESYDEIEDDYQRIVKICETIKKLCEKNKDFWKIFQSKTKDITLHNYNHLLSRQPYHLTYEGRHI